MLLQVGLHHNVYNISNYPTAFKLFFKFMKQKCFFAVFNILLAGKLQIIFIYYQPVFLIDKFQICALNISKVYS